VKRVQRKKSGKVKPRTKKEKGKKGKKKKNKKGCGGNNYEERWLLDSTEAGGIPR